jgi:mono/diheme cytochrome c family protein
LIKRSVVACAYPPKYDHQMKTKKNTLCFLLLTFLFSCGKKSSDVEFKVNQTEGQAEGQTAEVSYAQLKTQVLTPHCISCHSNAATETGLQQWITPGVPDQSALFTIVEIGSMPKNQPPLDTASLELVRNYILGVTPAPTGGGTTGGTPTPTPTPAGITYAQMRAAVLVPSRCVNCHSVGTEAQLKKWINTTTPINSKFYTTIKNGSMPQGGPRVSSENTALVLQYVIDFSNRQ